MSKIDEQTEERFFIEFNNDTHELKRVEALTDDDSLYFATAIDFLDVLEDQSPFVTILATIVTPMQYAKICKELAWATIL